MIKIAVVFGTRPEAIKMAPVIKELQKYPQKIKTLVVVSGQHRQMLDQVLEIFKIKPDFDLNIMQSEQTLSQITTNILDKIGTILEKEKLTFMLVHGDTPTAFVSALAGFYHKIPVGHVEAGLRTYNKYDPFPEEMNRRLIDVLCDLYFVPTKTSRDNLLREGIEKKKIFITGNTVIDALLSIVTQDYDFSDEQLKRVNFAGRRVIFVTAHRRESWGKGLENIFQALLRIVDYFEDTEIVFPVHLNPKVQRPARQILSKSSRIHLTKPLDYKDTILVMKKCYLVMTDSGGLQEEAPALGKPVLVLRRVTERPEGVAAGTLRLVGVRRERIFKEACRLLTSRREYAKMARAGNPYGDGKASLRIRKIIENIFLK